MPQSYVETKGEEGLIWLNTELRRETNPIARYRLARQMLIEYYLLDRLKAGNEVCQSFPPLREDYRYRALCLEAASLPLARRLDGLLELAYEARINGKNGLAAQFLQEIAWIQSQSGDVASAFENYETALTLAPTDDPELLNTIMFDTATNYIIHGDSAYIQKGISLLEQIIARSEKILERNSPGSIAAEDALADIRIANFNIGIAYTLHMPDYAAALRHFATVIEDGAHMAADATSFASLAAAKLGNHELARKYIQQGEGQSDSGPIVNTYLACYRELATRHWQPNSPIDSCLNLHPDTTIEVKLDVYKRLALSFDPQVQQEGAKKLADLFLTTLESRLRSRGSKAASNTELQRLQRESELKTIVLQQQKELQQTREEKHSARQRFFIALFLVLVFIILLIASLFRQKKKLAEQLERISTIDALTGLGNRRFLEQQMERELAFVERSIASGMKCALGIYLFDIDHFKKINDTYGHQAGDEVLSELSARICSVVRETDLLVRWGGEEFVFVARLDTKARTYQIADRIRRAVISEPFEISGYSPIKVTCTIGVVRYPFFDTSESEEWSRLISLADAALYFGKQYRDCWVAVNNKSVTELSQVEELLTQPLAASIKQDKLEVVTSLDAKSFSEGSIG